MDLVKAKEHSLETTNTTAMYGKVMIPPDDQGGRCDHNGGIPLVPFVEMISFIYFIGWLNADNGCRLSRQEILRYVPFESDPLLLFDHKNPPTMIEVDANQIYPDFVMKRVWC